MGADTRDMTASRTCRACGANLRGDVMWCLRCLEPMRQLTPREGDIPVASFVNTRPEAARSRWKAGATSFGPMGRIAITVGVLLFFPPTLGNPVTLFVYLPAYLAIAAMVLRSTWKKDVVERPIAVEGTSGEPRPELAVEPVPTAHHRRLVRAHRDRARRRDRVDGRRKPRARHHRHRREPRGAGPRVPLVHEALRPHVHSSTTPPNLRERFWKSRMASYRCSRLKSGHSTGVK
jgi:hypothetical protein